MKSIMFAFLMLLNWNQNPEHPDQNLINNLATKYRDFYINIVISVNAKGRDVRVVTTNTELYRLYNKRVDKKQYSTFKSFLTAVLTEKYSVQESADFHLYSISIVDKNAPMFKFYRMKGYQAVVNHYLKKEGNNLTERKQIQAADMNALIEIMFSHNYYVFFSDHSGIFSFSLKAW